jgi:lipoprotein NlpI
MAAGRLRDFDHGKPAARRAGRLRWRAVAFLLAWIAAGAVCAIEPQSDLARHLQAERRQRAELAIARTSQQIESSAVEGRALAAAFRARSVARSSLLQHAEALQDIAHAVELDPFNAGYYEDRARIHLKLREFKAAGADLDMALGLDSKRWSAQRDKGRLAAYQGQFLEAAGEFRRAWRLSDEETSIYNAIWVDIVERRGGGAGTAAVDDLLRELDPQRWPGPVLAMLREKLPPEEAVAAVRTTDPRAALPLRCEAHFYAGQVYLMRGETARAKAAFEAAVATGAVEYLEYDWALRELEMLSASR